jgi:hypothetical protein
MEQFAFIESLGLTPLEMPRNRFPGQLKKEHSNFLNARGNPLGRSKSQHFLKDSHHE